MNRKTFMQKVYCYYWIRARKRKYMFSDYDKNICKYICNHAPERGKLLDVACGTGYPFCYFFDKNDYLVYGIDIAPKLVEQCKKNYQRVICKVGDAENIEYPDNKFDITYCLHSSWYFSDLNKAIDEMIRVTCQNSFIIFDIQNRNNKAIEKNYQAHLSKSIRNRFKKYIKNIIKLFLLREQNWSFIVYETPSYPEDICKYLQEKQKKKQIQNFQVMTKEKDDTLKLQFFVGLFSEYPRILFIIKK